MSQTSYIKRLKTIFVIDIPSTLHESVYKEKQEIFAIDCDNVLSKNPNLVFSCCNSVWDSFQRHTSAQCRCVTYEQHVYCKRNLYSVCVCLKLKSAYMFRQEINH